MLTVTDFIFGLAYTIKYITIIFLQIQEATHQQNSSSLCNTALSQFLYNKKKTIEKREGRDTDNIWHNAQIEDKQNRKYNTEK